MQWFEDESFWETFYPFMFGEPKMAAAPAEVDRVLALSGMERGRVLDLCCGPARHSLVLAERGFEVTAVDRSPFLLQKARERIAGATIELVQSDMRNFVRPGAFDLALSLFTSFGYFDTRDQDLAVLRNIRASLKKDGMFLIDVISKEYLCARPAPTRWEDLPGGAILVQHYEVIPGWGRIRLKWLLVEGERVRRFTFAHNLYSGLELTALLERAGFVDIQIFGNLEGAPYDAAATRLVARARNPGEAGQNS